MAPSSVVFRRTRGASFDTAPLSQLTGDGAKTWGNLLWIIAIVFEVA